MDLPLNAQKLAEVLASLPGIGPKQANRLSVYLSGYNRSVAERLVKQINSALETIKVCEQCGNLAEEELCKICQNPTRDKDQILVVENVLDLLAMESAGVYQGIYCVLGKLLSPLNGVLIENIQAEYLMRRQNAPREIIFALPASVEGEMTAGYIEQQLKEKFDTDIKFSRLARGISRGVSMEYTDPDTLTAAFSNRS